jgi:hypothetical protein
MSRLIKVAGWTKELRASVVFVDGARNLLRDPDPEHRLRQRACRSVDRLAAGERGLDERLLDVGQLQRRLARGGLLLAWEPHFSLPPVRTSQ